MHIIRTVAGLALAIALLGSPPPAPAGEINGCCICQGCVPSPATQCFENPAQGCETQCSILNCAEFSNTQISCGQQPACPSFSAPAPAPALGPMGAALAALAMAAVALRRIH